jgi:ribose transport system permease protein
MESCSGGVCALRYWAQQPSFAIFIVLIVLVVFFQLSNPVFLSPVNVATMLRALSYSGIIAIGMALCLISGIIDLSVGSTAALSSVVFGVSIRDFGVDLLVAIVLALVAGAVVGIINSIIILKLKVTPFIATISMMFIVRGVANWISNGYNIYPLSDIVLELGYGRPLGVSWAFIFFIVCAALAHIILQYSLLGLLIRATGSDREVAICTEVDVDKINTITLITISMLAAFAGIFISLVINAGSPTVGVGWEFMAITACAIGGVSLFGYHGTIFGLCCGLLTVQVIQNGIVMLGVNPYSQGVVVGAILLAAMVVDVRRRTYLDLDRV